MNFYCELSSKSTGNGRRPIKLVLHEIYPNNSKWNDNGISWLEKYVSNNLDTIKDMSITAEFISDDRSEPYGHGRTDDGSESIPSFEGATVVGHCTEGYVDTMVIDGEEKRVCVALGTLDEMRYPKFIKWLEKQLGTTGASGSVEILGLPENGNRITYDGGYKKQGRVPMEYIYSGYAILGAIRGADTSAIIVELNSKNESEENPMDEKILAEVMTFKTQISEINTKLSELNTLQQKISECNELTQIVAEKDVELAALKALLEQTKAEYEEACKKYDEAWTKLRTLEEMVAKQEILAQVAEMESALSGFTDEQKAYAQSEINKFKENPSSIEINTIIGRIYVESAKAAEANNTIPGQSHEENTVRDIFSPVSIIIGKAATSDDEDIY